jgi:muramoyltetrapeptide carboxypeptidase
MVAADWARADGVDEPTWRAAVEGDDLWHVNAEDGLRVLREGEAEVEGRLLGGCLAMLAEGLGTPWALRVEEPCVLFVEDIGVKPFQWDRMLQHLRFAGLMKNVRGVVLGDMSTCVAEGEMELLEAACLHALREFRGPVAIGLRSGHMQGANRTLPLGAWVRMSGAELGEVA